MGPATQAVVNVDDAETCYTNTVSIFHRDKPNAEVGRRQALGAATDDSEFDRETRIAIFAAYDKASKLWPVQSAEDVQRLLEGAREDFLAMAAASQAPASAPVVKSTPGYPDDTYDAYPF